MPTGWGTRDFTSALPSLSVIPISWIAGRPLAKEVISGYKLCTNSGLAPSASTRSSRLSTTVSAVLSVVSICCETEWARLVVTNFASRNVDSRTCHICQASIPTRAAETPIANTRVQLSHEDGRGIDMVERRAGNRDDRLTLKLTPLAVSGTNSQRMPNNWSKSVNRTQIEQMLKSASKNGANRLLTL